METEGLVRLSVHQGYSRYTLVLLTALGYQAVGANRGDEVIL